MCYILDEESIRKLIGGLQPSAAVNAWANHLILRSQFPPACARRTGYGSPSARAEASLKDAILMLSDSLTGVPV